MGEFAISISRFAQMTEAEALDEEWDMIPKLTSYQKTLDFCVDLERRLPQLEELISRHLGISPAHFVLLGPSDWVWGSFNICLPIDIKPTAGQSTLPPQAVLRFPLPFRAGEENNPGNLDEKLRCEAATYIWLQRHCPSIPTPRLLGMGFPGAHSFTSIENESGWNRLIWQVQRGCGWLRGNILSPYSIHPRPAALSDLGYLLLEYVMQGDPLSSSWQQHRHDETRRINLYRSLSNVLLDLARVPLPRIGSWTMDDRRVISLTNRPLLDLTMLWNRHGLETPVPRTCLPTTTTDCRINQTLYRPGSTVFTTALRTLLSTFWSQRSHESTFVLTLTDLHRSNIFVDEDWNITGLIDFEFAPVQPVQMVHVPTWLSNQGIDDLTGPALVEYKELYDQFIRVLQEAETSNRQSHALSQHLQEDWESGRFWYNAALRSSNAFPLVFEQNIRPRFFDKFDLEVEGASLMQLWNKDWEERIAAKLKDKAQYDQRICEIFAKAKAANVGDKDASDEGS